LKKSIKEKRTRKETKENKRAERGGKAARQSLQRHLRNERIAAARNNKPKKSTQGKNSEDKGGRLVAKGSGKKKKNIGQPSEKRTNKTLKKELRKTKCKLREQEKRSGEYQSGRTDPGNQRKEKLQEVEKGKSCKVVEPRLYSGR